jgi:hypothetical protein
MMRRPAFFFSLLLASSALTASSCAMRSPSRTSEQAPPSPPPPRVDPTSSPTVTEDKDSSDVDMSGKSATGSVPPTMPTSKPGATPTIADDIPHAKVAFDQSEAAFNASGTDCAQMCKALASMQRAADHLCDLTKDGADLEKQKCTDARARVTTAKDRVSKMCGGCGP